MVYKNERAEDVFVALLLYMKDPKDERDMHIQDRTTKVIYKFHHILFDKIYDIIENKRVLFRSRLF